MKPPPRKSLTFTVTLDVQGDDPDRMNALFSEYLTLGEGPFAADYGPQAWGGWEGPFVTGVTVTDATGKVTRSGDADPWPKPRIADDTRT
jgi:hypothetical protein